MRSSPGTPNPSGWPGCTPTSPTAPGSRPWAARTATRPGCSTTSTPAVIRWRGWSTGCAGTRPPGPRPSPPSSRTPTPATSRASACSTSGCRAARSSWSPTRTASTSAPRATATWPSSPPCSTMWPASWAARPAAAADRQVRTRVRDRTRLRPGRARRGRLVRRGQLAPAGRLGQPPGFLQVQPPGLRRDPENRRAAHQVPGAEPDQRRAGARGAFGADLGIAAHQREAAHVQLDRVRDVDGRAAHDRDQVEGELAALDLGLAQVDLVSAHDGYGVDAADRAEPAAPLRGGHDGDHPAHRLPGRGRGGRRLAALRLAALGRQVAGQRGELAAGLGGQRPAGPVLELVQGEPADGGVLAERAQRLVPFGVRDPEGFVRVGHSMSLLGVPLSKGTPRPGRAPRRVRPGTAAAAGCWPPPGPTTSSWRRPR